MAEGENGAGARQTAAQGTTLGVLIGIRAALATALQLVDSLIGAHSPPPERERAQDGGGKRPPATFGDNRPSRGG